MEVEIKVRDYICVFDEITPKKFLNKFVDVMNAHSYFQQATVIGDGTGGHLDKDIRNADIWALGDNLNNMTEVHWANFFDHKIWIGAHKYCEKMKTKMSLVLKEMQA